MSVNSVDSDQYVDGSIDNAHLADDAVGTDELANNVVISTSGAITTTGAFSGGTALIGTGTLNRKLTVVGDNDEPDISLVQLHNANDNHNEIRFMSVGSDDSTYRVGGSIKAIYTGRSGTNPETNLTFWTRTTAGSLTERMRILSGGGVTFNGDTAAANALDDYEEGTWTPGVSVQTGSHSYTVSSEVGHYTRIGDVVTANFYMLIERSGSGDNGAGYGISGLPYAASSTANMKYSSSFLWTGNFSNNYGTDRSYPPTWGTLAPNQAYMQMTSALISNHTGYRNSYSINLAAGSNSNISGIITYKV
jgi:hypothetical protein